MLPCFLADPCPELERASEVLEVHGLHLAVHRELRKEPGVAAVRRWLIDRVEHEQPRLRGDDLEPTRRRPSAIQINPI